MSQINLSKQMKQYIILGAVGSLALLVLIAYGVKVSLSSVGDARFELADLKTKIENAERLLGRQELLRNTFIETSDELKSLIKTNPPERNYYSWATEIIYARARIVGLDIDAIDEVTTSIKSKEEEQSEITRQTPFQTENVQTPRIPSIRIVRGGTLRRRRIHNGRK